MMRVRVAPSIAAAALRGRRCGQKGPPLAPLHLIPGRAGEHSVARVGERSANPVRVPATNVNGAGPGRARSRRGLRRHARRRAMARRRIASCSRRSILVATIAVKPPPVEGEPAPPADAPPDTRPSAGDQATFVETLTADQLASRRRAAVPPGTVARRRARAAGALRRTGASPTAAIATRNPGARPRAAPFLRAAAADGVRRRPGARPAGGIVRDLAVADRRRCSTPPPPAPVLLRLPIRHAVYRAGATQERAAGPAVRRERNCPWSICPARRRLRSPPCRRNRLR